MKRVVFAIQEFKKCKKQVGKVVLALKKTRCVFDCSIYDCKISSERHVMANDDLGFYKYMFFMYLVGYKSKNKFLQVLCKCLV